MLLAAAEKDSVTSNIKKTVLILTYSRLITPCFAANLERSGKFVRQQHLVSRALLISLEQLLQGI